MLEYNLVENALHSLNEAIKYYMEGDENSNVDQYKFSILLTSHCSELLIKEILRSHHPAFIFENIDKIKDGNFEDDEKAKTVAYVDALNRVKNICFVDLGKYDTYLRNLGVIRNKIQHFKCILNPAYCKRIMTESFSAIKYIVLDILGLRFEDFESVISKGQIDFLHEDNDAYMARKRNIQSDIENNLLKQFRIEYLAGKYVLVPCPICGEKFLIIKGETIYCKMCGITFASHSEISKHDKSCIVTDAMLRELGRRKHIIRQPIYECPNCEYEAITYCETERYWLCWVCGNKFEDTAYCYDCSEEMPNSDSLYYTAISHSDTNNYKFLCPQCEKKIADSEAYRNYEIYRL